MSTSLAAFALVLGLTPACGSAAPVADLTDPSNAPTSVAVPLLTEAGAPILGMGSEQDSGSSSVSPTAPVVNGDEEAAAPDPDVGAGPQEPAQKTPVVHTGFDQAHAAWTEMLGGHVRGGRVDYGGWKKNAEQRAALTAYIGTLVEVTPEELANWSAEARLAFWVNVYNASVVNLIVENYPLKSIEDLTTKELKVWDRPVVALGAHLPKRPDGLSLNDVEHEILRERFADARIHAALNCAAESCPPLLDEAFRAEDLDEQLEARMRAFVNDSTRNAFNAKKKRLELSRLFEWFAADFERDAKSVPAYVQRYAPVEYAGWAGKPKKVEYLDYSWKLNDAR